MRRDVQEIFRMTPRTKQVMMFSATLSKEIRPTCKKFMQNVRLPQPVLISTLKLVLSNSLWKSTSMTRPSSPCMVCNNTTSSSRRLPRTASSMTCSMSSSSTRFALVRLGLATAHTLSAGRHLRPISAACDSPGQAFDRVLVPKYLDSLWSEPRGAYQALQAVQGF